MNAMSTTKRISVALGFLAAAGLAAGVWQGLDWHRDRDTLHQRQAAIDAASAEVTHLISVSGSASTADLAQLRAGATSAFAAELAAEASNLTAQLRAHDVVARGSVTSAGVGQSAADHSTVFIAASGTVSNTSSSSAQTRLYRFKVDMQRVGDQWLVSGLEFVA